MKWSKQSYVLKTLKSMGYTWKHPLYCDYQMTVLSTLKISWPSEILTKAVVNSRVSITSLLHKINGNYNKDRKDI